MRPKSILLFEKVFFASLAVGLVRTVAAWREVASAIANPTLKAASMSERAILTSLSLSLVLPLVLWFFIAHRASNVAKWFFLLLTAFGLLGFVQTLANPAAPKGIVTVLSALGVGLQIYAAWLLFDADAKDWLDGDDSPGSS
jgi:hypothetical protein